MGRGLNSPLKIANKLILKKVLFSSAVASGLYGDCLVQYKETKLRKGRKGRRRKEEARGFKTFGERARETCLLVEWSHSIWGLSREIGCGFCGLWKVVEGDASANKHYAYVRRLL